MASLPCWALSLDGFYLTGGPSQYHTRQYNLDTLPIEPTLQDNIQAWLRTPKWIGYGGAGYIISDDFTIGFDCAGWFPKEHQEQTSVKIAPVTPPQNTQAILEQLAPLIAVLIA